MTDSTERLSAALAGRYTLQRELGRGGMATVYLAQDTKHQRSVALKVLHPELAAALGSERFLREITTTAALDHPHILPLLDSGEAAGSLFYTMPFVEGESLRDRLERERQLPLEDALRITREVADALGYAHSRGVIHRDIKPENILLAGGHARVADFGIATAVAAGGGAKLTQTGFAVGTPAYMSPEQASADPQLDGRSDLYSLGCVLYEMLTGEVPYLGTTPQGIFAKKLAEPAPRVSVLRDTVPAGVEAALLTVLARSPADRYATAAQFAELLQRGATTPAATAAYRGAAARVRRRRARRAAVVAVIGVAGILAAALVGRALLGRGDAVGIFLDRAVPATSDPSEEIDPALSPDGTLLAYAAGPPGGTRIYVRQVAGGRPVAIADSGGPPQRWPKWSPDGRSVLYCVGYRALMVVPALGGPPRSVWQDSLGGLYGADWSPDGREIAVTARDSLRVIPMDGGARRSLGRFDQAHSPAWSPDGGAIALVSGNYQYVHHFAYGNTAVSTIVVVPTGGGDPVQVTDGRSLAVSPAWLPGGRGLLLVSDQGGSRDVFAVRLDRAWRPLAPPARATLTARPHSIALSRDGRRLAYNEFHVRRNIWALPIPPSGVADAAAARPVTQGSQVIESLALSRDGRWIYYDSDRSGRAELYRIPTTGGEATQLTDAAGGHVNPYPSPDGTELAFQSQRNGTRDIFVMPAEGGAATPVHAGPGNDWYPTWSPDGRSIGFSHSGEGMLKGYYVAQRTGEGWSEPRLVTQTQGLSGGWLAPDGSAVLFDSTVSLVTVSLQAGTRRVPYARRGPGDPGVSSPRYALDGRILFLGIVGGRRGFYAASAGSGPARLLVRFDDPLRQPWYAAFHSDGTRLFFTLDDRESDIWVADVRAR
jgi:Tol biopolymer transport system component